MGDTEGIDGADVDDPRRGRRRSGGLDEEGRQELREGEDALEVEGEEFGPGVVWVCIKGFTPCGAAVVDEHVETGARRAAELGG